MKYTNDRFYIMLMNVPGIDLASLVLPTNNEKNFINII